MTVATGNVVDESETANSALASYYVSQEISSQPKLRIGGSTMGDIIQGELGDCWFLASLASVAKQKNFLNQVGLHADDIAQSVRFTCLAICTHALCVWSYQQLRNASEI